MWTPEQRGKYGDNGERYPSDPTDAGWETVAPLPSVYHPLTADLREMVNGCLYHEKTGCRWRFMPQDLGPPGTVRYRHDRFRRDGLWADLSALLIRAVRQRRGRPAEPATAILDSQSVTSGPQGGERGVDGKKPVRGIKRHVLTCSLGFVLGVPVTPANVHDTAAAGILPDRVAADGFCRFRLRLPGSDCARFPWGRRSPVAGCGPAAMALPPNRCPSGPDAPGGGRHWADGADRAPADPSARPRSGGPAGPRVASAAPAPRPAVRSGPPPFHANATR